MSPIEAYDDITVPQLKKYLDDNDIEYKASDNKPELYDAYKKHITGAPEDSESDEESDDEESTDETPEEGSEDDSEASDESEETEEDDNQEESDDTSDEEEQEDSDDSEEDEEDEPEEGEDDGDEVLYYGGKQIVGVDNRIINGRLYKHVTTVDQVQHTLTEEEFASDVTTSK